MKAIWYFDLALQKDDKNIYAATGMAIAFAQWRKIAEAKDMFAFVR